MNIKASIMKRKRLLVVEGYSKQQIAKGRAKFITMSIIGIILFLIPVPVTQDGEKQTTLPVAFLANWLKGLLGAMPIIIILLLHCLQY